MRIAITERLSLRAQRSVLTVVLPIAAHEQAACGAPTGVRPSGRDPHDCDGIAVINDCSFVPLLQVQT